MVKRIRGAPPVPGIGVIDLELYWFKHAMQPRWTWAQSLIPKLDEISRPCAKCGIGRVYPGRYPERDFDVMVKGGSAYPDVLGCGAYPFLIVSEYVIQDWETCGINGYRKYAINVRNVGHYEAPNGFPPQYYHIQITGRVALDLNAMGVEVKPHCSECGYRRATPSIQFPFVFAEQPDPSSDLFVSDWYPAITFCNHRVLRAAASNRRTNFRFLLPATCGNPIPSEIDYLGDGG